MTERSKREPGKKPKVEKLELNRETIQDLTDAEAEVAIGGLRLETAQKPACASEAPRGCSHQASACGLASCPPKCPVKAA